MKAVVYASRAARDLARHANVAARIRKAIREYAENPTAHANNVTALIGEDAKRMRIGTYRVVFVETETEIVVVKIGPRGSVYD